MVRRHRSIGRGRCTPKSQFIHFRFLFLQLFLRISPSVRDMTCNTWGCPQHPSILRLSACMPSSETSRELHQTVPLLVMHRSSSIFRSSCESSSRSARRGVRCVPMTTEAMCTRLVVFPCIAPFSHSNLAHECPRTQTPPIPVRSAHTRAPHAPISPSRHYSERVRSKDGSRPSAAARLHLSQQSSSG